MKSLHCVAYILVIIGGLNWLLVALGWDIAGWSTAGWWATLVNIVYVLVGLSAIVEIFTHKTMCKNCGFGGGVPMV